MFTVHTGIEPLNADTYVSTRLFGTGRVVVDDFTVTLWKSQRTNPVGLDKKNIVFNKNSYFPLILFSLPNF